MADLSSYYNTYTNAGVGDADSILGANAYKQETPWSRFSTRDLTFLKVVVSGGTPPDLSVSPGATNSDFVKALRALQNFGELQFVGAPSATAFVVAVAGDTLQSNVGIGQPSGTASAATYADAEAQVLAALGSWGSGVVTISALTASGASIA
jgi:hypothetical protein